MSSMGHTVAAAVVVCCDSTTPSKAGLRHPAAPEARPLYRREPLAFWQRPHVRLADRATGTLAWTPKRN